MLDICVNSLRGKHCILQVSGAQHGISTIRSNYWLHLHGVYQDLDLECGHFCTSSFWHVSSCIEHSEMRRSVLLSMVITGRDTARKFHSDSFLMSSECYSAIQVAWFLKHFQKMLCNFRIDLHRPTLRFMKLNKQFLNKRIRIISMKVT